MKREMMVSCEKFKHNNLYVTFEHDEFDFQFGGGESFTIDNPSVLDNFVMLLERPSEYVIHYHGCKIFVTINVIGGITISVYSDCDVMSGVALSKENVHKLIDFLYDK